MKKTTFRITETLSAYVSLDMISIPSGTFIMGSPENESGRYSDEVQRSVTVPAFLMAKTSITQAQWRVVAGWEQVNLPLNPEPSRFNDRDNLPVEQVSWYEAMEFCARLTKRTGRTYTLPSDAQWEYACRAGTTTPFHFGETITADLANFYGNATVPVGQFSANNFGLYDMHGNVWEWCLDAGQKFGDKKEKYKVLRGGSWFSNPALCRSAYRGNYVPGGRGNGVGFRVVCL